MASVIKLRVGDQELDVIEQQFQIAKEDWNEYTLYDGGTVRVKTIVQKIFRVVDSEGKPAFSPDGEPHIVVKHNSQVSASD